MNIPNARNEYEAVMQRASLRVTEATRKIGEGLSELRAAQSSWLKAMALDSDDPIGSLIRYGYSARSEHGGGPLQMANITDTTRREAALYLAAHFGHWADRPIEWQAQL